MASEKEEIILDFKVDSGDLVTELEKLKTLIVANKKEQIQLNKAFKDGKITESEFAKESVRVENALKRQQKQYGDTQKAVLGHKSKIDELIKSNNNLAKTNQGLSTSFKDAANNINIAGTNVGSLTSKLSSFTSPAGAAVGVVTALAAAYAKSTIGAKDLEFAQNQLASVVNISTNAFAGLISSSKDGEGLLTKLLNFALKFSIVGITDAFGLTSIQKDSKQAALNIDKLEDLQREEIEIRDKNNQRLEENQELLTQLSEEQTSYNDKIGLTNRIITNLRNNENDILDVLKQELTIIEEQLKIDGENEEIQTARLLKKKEISNVERDTEKKVQAILRMEGNIQEAENKRLVALREIERINSRISGDPNASKLEAGVKLPEIPLSGDSVTDRVSTLEDERTRILRQAAEDRKKIEEDSTKFFVEQEQAKLQAAASISGALSNLFAEGSQEQKFFALLGLGIDTAEAIGALTAASEQNPLNGPSFGAAGIAQYAAGIVRILTNIATAKQYLGFASGGYTGDGDPRSVAGVVHRKEVVWNAEDVNLAGGPSVVNAMRPTARRRSSRGGGYYDGGIVAANASAQIDQQLAMANAFKNMPRPVVSVKEITRAQDRVEVKEEISNR